MSTKARTTPEKPLDLPAGMELDPKPVPGCAGCDVIAHDRDRARANGDASGVSDCNVRMRRHEGDTHL
ncbi:MULTISPECIES: hypothetical protein [unclassified Streptomyces]|uniref:hypothetical protein n=1 Tax=unclassified Streptomyces TaxID=2593676 RepID=UPI003392CB3A